MRKNSVTAMHGDRPKGSAHRSAYCPVEQAPEPNKLKGRLQSETPRMAAPEAYKKARKGKTDS